MLPAQAKKPRILFLFSDTGGGHRSAAEAIIEALNLEYPDEYDSRMVDIFRDYAPPPLQHAPELYPEMTKVPDMWGLGFHISDGRRRVLFYSKALMPYLKKSVKRLVDENPTDIFVSVHPLINHPLLELLGNRREVPFVTVVTDPVSVHAAWFDPRSDLTMVVTDQARKRALKLYLSPDKVKTIGLPVADRFCHDLGDKDALREQLGWQTGKRTALLVGGGDGMGPLYEMARAINNSGIDMALTMVCGRNHQLKEDLEGLRWKIPVKIYGFTRQMPEMMQASDVLITKAGPGTITEALNSGLPIILYSRLPGQEEGNVDYVVDNNVGVWAPDSFDMVEHLRFWFANEKAYQRTSANAKALANPLAARQIAGEIVRKLGRIPKTVLN